jgi:hypothetical protein
MTATTNDFAAVFGSSRGTTGAAKDQQDHWILMRGAYNDSAELLQELLNEIRQEKYARVLRIFNGQLTKSTDLLNPNFLTLTFTMTCTLLKQAQWEFLESVLKNTYQAAVAVPKKWTEERTGDFRESLEERYSKIIQMKLLAGTLSSTEKLLQVFPAYTEKQLFDDPGLYRTERVAAAESLEFVVSTASASISSLATDPEQCVECLEEIWDEVVRRKAQGEPALSYENACALF